VNSGKTIFAQLMDFLPIYEFHQYVQRYHGHYKMKSFSCWDQFLCMAFAQLTYRESLRDIEACLRSAQWKLYKGIVIDVDNYLLELSRYLHLNPVRAGMVKRPEEYAHSSYRSFIGLGKKKEGIVTRDRIWGMISGDRRRATQKYRRYVEEGVKKESRNPLGTLYGGAILGSGEFVQEL